MKRENLLLLNLNHIGDILFTTPAIRALKERYPEARITAVVLKGMEDVLRHHPCVDEVLTRGRRPLDILKMVPKVRARRPSISVLFTFSSVRMAALGKFSGAETRVGFDDPGLARFLTHPIKQEPTAHRVEIYLDLARAVGAEIRHPRMEMFFSDEDRRFAGSLLQSLGVSGDRPLVALSPGSSVLAKQWFPERYAHLADRLAADGIEVLLVGAPSERCTIDEVLRAAKSQPRDAAGKTRIGQLAALLDRCDAVVSNDTGPLHMAVSVGTPVVAVFGPTDPRRTGPYCKQSVALWDERDCAPCGHRPQCENRDCLLSITVDRVYDAVAKLAVAGRDER